jgi:hypothetical protein
MPQLSRHHKLPSPSKPLTTTASHHLWTHSSLRRSLSLNLTLPLGLKQKIFHWRESPCPNSLATTSCHHLRNRSPPPPAITFELTHLSVVHFLWISLSLWGLNRKFSTEGRVHAPTLSPPQAAITFEIARHHRQPSPLNSLIFPSFTFSESHSPFQAKLTVER